MILIQEIIAKKSNKKRAEVSQGFFKTGQGEYGEGDLFLGLSNPEMRKISKEYQNLLFSDLQILLNSKYHEERQIALFILALQFEKADTNRRTKIYNFYLKNIKRINNWDMVDLSAPIIMGKYLYENNKNILYSLAKSDNLWKRRISILATFYFIRNNKFRHTLKISKILLSDKEDLIHKAVGWMLREVGKRSIKAEEAFLKKNYNKMPRTMLRYAIEKFPEKKRQAYLKGEI